MNKTLIIYMGTSILIRSFIGGYGSGLMSEQGINLVYGILAAIAVVLMFFPKKGLDDIPLDQVTFNKWLAAGLAFIVGIGAGVVRAAGAFVLVPIMLVVLKIPTRMTIATSLAISFGATIGKITTDQVLYEPAAIMIVASLLASPLGAKAGQKVNTKILQVVLALLILGTSIKIWLDIL